MAKLNYKNISLLLLFLLLCSTAQSQVSGDEDVNMFNQALQRDQKAIDAATAGWWRKSMKTHDQRIAWWREARFGMFIHWGLYSNPAGEWKGKKVNGYSEHLMRKEKITRSAYLDLAHEFNPLKFNAEEWILKAKNAGMGYFIITAKHHDGFAMYDSKVSDFNIMQQTPFKRDPMAELAAAAKKHSMKFGFYYSHAFDWEHPDAPGNDWEYQNPGGDKLLGGANWFDSHPDWLPKAVKYVNQKAIPQIKELINKYHPDILWFDTPHKLPLSENLRILEAIRETDPDIVVNGRLARSNYGSFGDYLNTGDRPAELRTVAGDSEAIPTTNESYGYSKHDNSHKSPKFFIQLLANSASRGGNLLMNIGPKGDGSFDEKDISILDEIGAWMKINSASIKGTKRSALPIPSWGVITQKANLLYLHVFNWPTDGNLLVGGLKSNVTNAYLLTDPSRKKLITKRLTPDDVTVTLPQRTSDVIDAVVVLEVKGNILADTVRRLAKNGTNRLLAFDAQLHGKKFTFGDGKTDRYYVDGWKLKDQYLSWTLKSLQAAKYKVVVKYIAGSTSGAAYEIQLGAAKMNAPVVPPVDGIITTQDTGTISVPVGKQLLTIKPTQIKGAELMKLLEVQLIPVQ